MSRPANSIRTDENRSRFLSALNSGTSIATACRACGFDRSTAYDWRRDDPNFRQAWDDAIENGTDRVEDLVLREAVEKRSLPAMFGILRARRPERWARNSKADADADIAAAAIAEQQKELAETELVTFTMPMGRKVPEGATIDGTVTEVEAPVERDAEEDQADQSAGRAAA
jgi:hypothetical protein